VIKYSSEENESPRNCESFQLAGKGKVLTIGSRASCLFDVLALGLTELVASNSEEFVQIAVRLASDPLALAALRRNLRQVTPRCLA
jgi:hypothetical protein